MNAQKYLDEVRIAVANSERFFVQRRAKEKRRAFHSSLSVSIAAAIATFAVGFGTAVPDAKTVTTVLALGAGSLTTVLAAYESHWDYKKLWTYRTQIVFLIQQLLRSIDLYIGQLSADEIPDQAVVLEFHERHEAIRGADLKAWGRLRGVEFADLGMGLVLAHGDAGKVVG
ncbi:MAG: SLATT domain-containing protein [Acidimicrobiales bacterium]